MMSRRAAPSAKRIAISFGVRRRGRAEGWRRRAHDQEYKTGSGGEHAERIGHGFTPERRTLRAGDEFDRVLLAARAGVGPALAHEAILHLRLENTEGCLRLVDRDTGFQAAHHPQPEHVRAVPHFGLSALDDGHHRDRAEDSFESPGNRPSKPFSATPTISSGKPLAVILDPTTAGLARIVSASSDTRGRRRGCPLA